MHYLPVVGAVLILFDIAGTGNKQHTGVKRRSTAALPQNRAATKPKLEPARIPIYSNSLLQNSLAGLKKESERHKAFRAEEQHVAKDEFSECSEKERKLKTQQEGCVTRISKSATACASAAILAS